MIDIDIDNVQDQVIAEAKEKLEAFLASVDYPIEKKLVICGDLSERVNQAGQGPPDRPAGVRPSPELLEPAHLERTPADEYRAPATCWSCPCRSDRTGVV